MPRHNLSPIERIESLSIPEPMSGCWLWLGKVGVKPGYAEKYQYGHINVTISPGIVKTVKAHRFSYEAHHGKIPQGLLVCHHCDNPLCVNPDHLFVGTPKDNAQDALKKGRFKKKLKGVPLRKPDTPSWKYGTQLSIWK